MGADHMNADVIEAIKAVLTADESPVFTADLRPGEGATLKILGQKGDTGEQGDIGPQGERGEKGDTGRQGPEGQAGPQGFMGRPGIDGIDGKDGERGLRGEKGAKGDRGDRGFDGKDGEQGEQGPRGFRGPAGPGGGGGGGSTSGGSALTVKDEGTSLSAAVTSIDFAGAGVTATTVGTAVTVTIPGGVASDDQTAAEVPFTPTGTIAATDVQAAIAELGTEKAALASAVMDGDAAGGDLGGTYPNPSVSDDSHSHTAATLPTPAVDGLAAVLGESNDGAGQDILDVRNIVNDGATDSGGLLVKATYAPQIADLVLFTDGEGSATATLRSTDGTDTTQVVLNPTTLTVLINDDQGSTGQALVSDGAGHTVWGTPAEPVATAHIADGADAHDASAISFDDTAAISLESVADVQTALHSLDLLLNVALSPSYLSFAKWGVR